MMDLTGIYIKGKRKGNGERERERECVCVYGYAKRNWPSKQASQDKRIEGANVVLHGGKGGARARAARLGQDKRYHPSRCTFTRGKCVGHRNAGRRRDGGGGNEIT